MTVRFSKKDGAPVRFIAADDPEEAAAVPVSPAASVTSEMLDKTCCLPRADYSSLRAIS